MALKLTKARAADGLNRMIETICGGSQGGIFKIYSGTPPATCETTLSGNSILAYITIADGNTAYNTSNSETAGGPTATGNLYGGIFAATSTMNPMVTGTATFFRLFNNSAAVVCQGTVGTSGADMNLSSTAFLAGGSITINSSTIQLTGLT